MQGDEGGGGGGAGPGSALGKSAFQLSAEDVYDIAYTLGRELHGLLSSSSSSSPPGAELPARVAQLQFQVVRVLELLEALVSEKDLAAEALRMERDSLRREAEGLRAQAAAGSPDEVNLGPNKVVIDLTDVNRPRFTLQELKEVLQERNRLKAQLLVAQEELQCYKSGLISQKQDWVEPTQKEAASGTAVASRTGTEEKGAIRRLFAFKRPR
ncbi:RILP-like protein 2 [Elgaria multicarinata webbii]|uniref:RILP-like protein 2 n=1 Tax=Elgaria multicarinata webbii TaxID=159646 RepID=UPI002FCD64B0